MSSYNFKVKELVKLGRINFIDIGPQMGYGREMAVPTPVVIFEHIIKHVKEHKVERLVLDSLSAVRFSSEDTTHTDREINRLVYEELDQA